MFSIILGFVTGGLSKIANLVGKLLKWLTANPTVFLSLVFGIAFVLVVVSKNDEIRTRQKEITERDARIVNLTAQARIDQENVAKMTGALDQQNKSILALRAQGDASSARFDQLMTSMAAGNAAASNKIDDLKKATPGADKCASALSLIRSSVK